LTFLTTAPLTPKEEDSGDACTGSAEELARLQKEVGHVTKQLEKYKRFFFFESMKKKKWEQMYGQAMQKLHGPVDRGMAWVLPVSVLGDPVYFVAALVLAHSLQLAHTQADVAILLLTMPAHHTTCGNSTQPVWHGWGGGSNSPGQDWDVGEYTLTPEEEVAHVGCALAAQASLLGLSPAEQDALCPSGSGAGKGVPPLVMWRDWTSAKKRLLDRLKVRVFFAEFVEDVCDLSYLPRERHFSPSLRLAALAKVWVWGLLHYRKVIMLDVDQVMEENMDDMFHLPELTAPVGVHEPLNAGFIVLRPSARSLADMLALVRERDFDVRLGWKRMGSFKGLFFWKGEDFLFDDWTTFYGAGLEQGLFFYYFSHVRDSWHAIPYPFRVKHYTDQTKPWSDKRGEVGSENGRQLWWDVLESLERLVGAPLM